jgi:hypothetical protein
LAACVLVGIGVVAFWPGEREPEYNGKKLSEWLGESMKADGDNAEAVRAIGTNALPYLVRWLDFERPQWQYELIKLGRKGSPRIWNKYFVNDNVRMNNAIWAFDNLGAQAGPAIPGLVRLMKTGRTNVAGTAAYVLGGIGEQATPFLLDVLTNRPAYPRLETGRFGTMVRRPLTNGDLLVPTLVSSLTNQDAELRGNAATMLGELQARPHIVVPELAKLVRDGNKNTRYRAIVALEKFGTNARPAVVDLLPALNDSDRSIRHTATHALRAIESGKPTNGAEDF